MKTLISILLLCFVPAVVAAAPLKVVNVSAPAINCVFNPGCTVTVNDTTDNIMMSTGGTGFLQARTYMGAAGSPAAGLYAYEYRIDLRNAVGAVAISCIDWMTISFGPVVSTLNYGGDAIPRLEATGRTRRHQPDTLAAVARGAHAPRVRHPRCRRRFMVCASGAGGDAARHHHAPAQRSGAARRVA